jgi:chemotaxis signal transduction protein
MSGELPEELMDIGTESDLLGDEEEEGPLDVEEAIEETERITVFELGGESYGVPVMEVDQVVRTSPLTRVPRTAAAIDGIIDIRGEITVVINPWVHLDLPTDPRPWERQLVVGFQTADGEQSVGLRIDQIVGVEPIPVSQVDYDDPGDAPNGDSPLVEGVARRVDDDEVVDRIGLLDTDATVSIAGQHPHVTDGGSDATADD